MEKVYKDCDRKLVPDPFLILLNRLKWSMDARNSFEIEIFLKLVPAIFYEFLFLHQMIAL